MTPSRFSIKDNKTIFHYKYSELKEFLTRGFEFGDVGLILVSRKDNIFTYRGFGTIDHPFTFITTINMSHNRILDGELLADEEIVNSKVFESYANTSYSFWIEDIS